MSFTNLPQKKQDEIFSALHWKWLNCKQALRLLNLGDHRTLKRFVKRHSIETTDPLKGSVQYKAEDIINVMDWMPSPKEFLEEEERALELLGIC